MSRVLLSSPDVGQDEEDALVRAIRSGWVAPLGPEVDSFERELADYSGRRHAVALSSGTAALHLALLTLGVGPGDVVVTSTMTFAATANSIMYTGAHPIFVDSDETGNIAPNKLRKALETLTREGTAVGAVVTVDLLGQVADQQRIAAVAAEFDVPVLSDAAESLGAVRDGRSSAAYGVAAAVSFNGNKIMTTSGGGALLTDDGTFADNVRYLATQARQPVAHYEHTEVGYNYRLSNILAALGRAQLGRLDSMIEKRRQMRLRYRELFAGVAGVTVFQEPSEGQGGQTRDNFWLTSILIDAQVAGFTNVDLIAHLDAAGIEARRMWKPMHLQPVFAHARAFVDGTSESIFERGASLPSGSALKAQEIVDVETALREFLGNVRARP